MLAIAIDWCRSLCYLFVCYRIRVCCLCNIVASISYASTPSERQHSAEYNVGDSEPPTEVSCKREHIAAKTRTAYNRNGCKKVTFTDMFLHSILTAKRRKKWGRNNIVHGRDQLKAMRVTIEQFDFWFYFYILRVERILHFSIVCCVVYRIVTFN